jgi:urease accessory protein
MVAVGLWAAQRGGRAVWVVPVTFVAMMPVGGLLGAMGIIVPFVEPGIVASMIVLGVLITAAVPMPLVAMSLLVGLFAIFHGHAHGAEIPETVSGLAYAVGFVLATGLLHCCGIGFGLYARRFVDAQPIRYAGGAIAALGIALFIA